MSGRREFFPTFNARRGNRVGRNNVTSTSTTTTASSTVVSARDLDSHNGSLRQYDYPVPGRDTVGGRRQMEGMARRTNTASSNLLTAAASPIVAAEVREVFRANRGVFSNSTPASVTAANNANGGASLRNVGPLFSPSRPSSSRSGRGNHASGSRFRRKVVLLPTETADSVPRGAFRDHLEEQNLEIEVQFRTGLTAEAVRRQILTQFQGFGHLENVRTFPGFTFLWPLRSNRLLLAPISEEVARSLTGSGLKTKWRANRPVYIRPQQRLTSYQDHRLPTRSTNEQPRQQWVDMLTAAENNLQDAFENASDEDEDEDQLPYSGVEVPEPLDLNTDVDMVDPSNTRVSDSPIEIHARTSGTGRQSSTSTFAVGTADSPIEIHARTPTVRQSSTSTFAVGAEGNQHIDADPNLANSGVEVDFQGEARPSLFTEPIYCESNVGRVVSGPIWMPVLNGFTCGQARAQQFAAQLLNLCGDSPALSHAMIPVGFDVIQLQCQLDEQLLFVMITNDDTEPGELQSITNETVVDMINSNGYLWGANEQHLQEGTIGIDTQHLPVLAIMHPMASGRMRLHHQFNNIGQRQVGIEELQTAVQRANERLQMVRDTRMRQNLRREQDEAYNASLQADQQRGRDRQRRQVQQQAERERARERARAEEEAREEIEELRALLAQTLPDEAQTGIRLRIRSTTGQHLTRTFSFTDTNAVVYQAAFTGMNLPTDNFTIVQRGQVIPRNGERINLENASVLDVQLDDE